MKTVLVIDGDMVAYRHAAAVNQVVDWGDGITTTSSNSVVAKARITNQIAEWCKKFTATPRIALSCPRGTCYRNSLLPSYKTHRNVKTVPTALEELKQFLVDEYAAEEAPTLEADDLMGIWMTEPGATRRIGVTVDKDLRTVPGLWWNPVAPPAYDDADLPLEISTGMSRYWHLYQTLVGDSSDGFGGCRGIGPKRAREALLIGSSRPADLWAAVVKTFESRGQTTEDALRNARLAYILQHGDWDGQTVRLWEPPLE